MRFALGAWLIVLLLSLFMAGVAVDPCQATTSTYSIDKTSPIVTSSILSNEETVPSKGVSQSDYLSMSIKTDKKECLTEEAVEITVTTSQSGTSIRVMVQLPNGNKETISNFTTGSTYTFSWTAPSTPGQVKLTCEGEATVVVWSTCTGVTCDSKGNCQFYTYPCQQSMQVTSSASTEISIFSRETSISGKVTDTMNHPVAGAIVRLSSDAAAQTTTDATGNYKLAYHMGDDYQLVSHIPTATETISFEAIACEPDDLNVKVPAERGVINANIALQRFFYPPAIDLSEFTFDRFSNWPKARNLETWQNILAIAVEAPTETKRLAFQGKELQPNNDFKTFHIDDQTLYLIVNPEMGRYFLDIESEQSGQYTVAASATIASSYIEERTLSDEIEAGKSQKLRLTLETDSLELIRSKEFPLALIIIPITISLAGGLAAAYFITGGKLDKLKKTFAGVKLPKLGKAAEESKPLEAATPKAARKARRKTKSKAKAITTIKPKAHVDEKSGGKTQIKIQRKVEGKSEAKPKGEAQRITKAKSVTVAKPKTETQLKAKTKGQTSKKVA